MKASFFRGPHEFQQSKPYRILPLRFMRSADSDVFISSDVGEWLFLPAEVFSEFAAGRLSPGSDAYRDLKGKHFLDDDGTATAPQLLATKFRTKKAFLDGFTSLHLFVVSLRCDHSCPYCQVSRVSEDRTRYDMSQQTALKAVDFMFRSPSPQLKVEFQGGESLLHFDAIRWIADAVRTRNQEERRDIQFVIATNLARLDDDVISFCRDYDVQISTSLDGPAFLHNTNRPRPGKDSYERVVANIEKVRSQLGPDRVSALMTTTAESLRYPGEIVDEYVARGFGSVFLRPLSPYGFAVRTKQSMRYETEAFLDFYKAGLARVIDWNRKGTPLMENYSRLILQKLLTPFATRYVDLQSPAGAGISAIVYNYDGDIYASDEGRMLAEMNDFTFRLGSLHDDTYESVMGGSQLSAIVEQSITEVLPGCSDCAYMPFCGADPVFHWATQSDMVGHRPTSAFCQRNMGVIEHLLGLLKAGDSFTRELLTGWGV